MSAGHAPVSRVWRIATGLAAAAVLGVGVWATSTHKRGTGRSTEMPMRQYATHPGERAEIRLIDNSTVMLGPESILRIPADFGDSTRDLVLDGEAYFDVQHDTLRPFRVHARDAVVRDVGTKFTILSYTDDDDARVVVTEGRVAVSAAQDSLGRSVVLLTPGQMIEVSPSGAETITRVDIEPYVAWAGGRLMFKEIPLRDAAVQLSRWYGRDLRPADPAIGRRLLTAEFRDESFPEMLRLLEAALDLRATRDGSAIVLRDAHRQ